MGGKSSLRGVDGFDWGWGGRVSCVAMSWNGKLCPVCVGGRLRKLETLRNS